MSANLPQEVYARGESQGCGKGDSRGGCLVGRHPARIEDDDLDSFEGPARSRPPLRIPPARSLVEGRPLPEDATIGPACLTWVDGAKALWRGFSWYQVVIQHSQSHATWITACGCRSS